MNYSDICRLCLIKTIKSGDELFFPIDDVFAKKYQEVTNSILHKSSNFPNLTCISCITEFEKYYNYRKGLIEKQNKLNTLLVITDEKPNLDKQDFSSECNEIVTVKSNEELVEELVDDIIEPDYTEEVHIDENFYEKEFDELIEHHPEDPELDEEVIETNEENDEEYYKEFTLNQDLEEDYIVVAKEIDDEGVKQKKRHNSNTAKQFKCWMPECTSTFSFRATMRKHMLQIHNLKCDKSTCMICGNKYSVYSEFLAHVKIHTRKAECDICKLKFVNDEKMKAHKERVHANDCNSRVFPCKFCNALFKRREHVRSHILYKHTLDIVARNFHCKECSSSFLTRQDMKNHEKTHLQVKIKCCYCSFDCRDLKTIRRHCNKMHNTNKIYKCVCSKVFELHKDLQQHKKLLCSCSSKEIAVEN